MKKAGWIISALAVVTAGIVYLRPLGAQTPPAAGGVGGVPAPGAPGVPTQPGFGGTTGGATAGAPGQSSSGATTVITPRSSKEKESDDEEATAIPEEKKEARRLDLTSLLSTLGATGSYGGKTYGVRGAPVSGAFLAHYLVPDRRLIRGGIWRFGITETGTRYHRFSCPMMLAANPGKVAGFATWQEAMAAGYTADSICQPSPVAEVLAVAREITSGPVEIDPRDERMIMSLLPQELVEVLRRAADKSKQRLFFEPRPEQGAGGMPGGGMGMGEPGMDMMPGMMGGSGGGPMPGMPGMGMGVGGGYNPGGGGMMPSMGAPGGGIAFPGG